MKFPKCNLHTHTRYCDGRNTAEEMVTAAISAGMEIIGFSGHSPLSLNDPDCDDDWCMTRDGAEHYRSEIAALKEKYGDRILVLCGIEQDFLSGKPTESYDYVIGSVHFVRAPDGALCPVDAEPERVRNDVEKHFGGDFYAWTQRYFETVSHVVEVTGCDIIGHFDLVQKFNENDKLFAAGEPRYRKPLIDALTRLLATGRIFEINTGAMSRGYRKEPYPDAYALRWIAANGGKVMLTADAHRKDDLMFGFREAASIAKSCGVGGLVVPDSGKPGQWKTVPIGSERYPK